MWINKNKKQKIITLNARISPSFVWVSFLQNVCWHFTRWPSKVKFLDSLLQTSRLTWWLMVSLAKGTVQVELKGISTRTVQVELKDISTRTCGQSFLGQLLPFRFRLALVMDTQFVDIFNNFRINFYMSNIWRNSTWRATSQCPITYFFCIHCILCTSAKLLICHTLWAKLIDVIELYVLVLLGYYLCLNFSRSVSCATNKNENRCACESPKCSQVCDLFNHRRTSS